MGSNMRRLLESIPARRVDRLLEDILDPNRNVDGTYRSSAAALADGRVLSGLVVREGRHVLVLAYGEGRSHELPLRQVSERRVPPLSPMPANAAEHIAERDCYDLLAILLGKRGECGCHGSL